MALAKRIAASGDENGSRRDDQSMRELCCYWERKMAARLKSSSSGVRFSKDPETLRARKSSRKVPENNFGCFSKRPRFSGPEKTCSFPEKFYGCLRAPEKSVNKSRESSVNKKWLPLVHF